MNKELMMEKLRISKERHDKAVSMSKKENSPEELAACDDSMLYEAMTMRYPDDDLWLEILSRIITFEE